MAGDAKEVSKEETTETTKKKGGKLPIIVVLALVLGGGGFFMMKMKAPKTDKKPEVKLGKVLPLEEFLVNLSNGSTYLRTSISLHLADTAKIEAGKGEGKGGGAEMDVIKDAIIGVLTSKSPREISTIDGKKKLRADIAKAVNEQLENLEAATAEGTKKAEKEIPKQADSKAEGADAKDGKKESVKHPDWDSQEGPVLKVYFTTFATQ